ncbi:MAG: glutathione S-transferase domain-containing protein, partial [Proteobacteria bacterium]|nr:glutathione S-transferase domain-containing protein [Pseudomonadota bacterium]
IESLYLELLTRLDAHFSEHPYLLGNRPCIGDFGLIAPLYAHLGRDPKPLSIMQAHGIRVFRWVERMNRPEADIGEFENQDETYLPGDEIPQTLIDVLRQLAIDFVPETRAAMECINDWLAQQDELPAGTPVERGVGFAGFEMEGVSVSALAQPFRFYLLKRVQDDFDSMNDPDQAAVTALLKACDLSGILDYRLNREIGRDRNLEVWL